MKICESRHDKDVKSDDPTNRKTESLEEILNNSAPCINEKCAWNLKQRCAFPDICPGRNKNTIDNTKDFNKVKLQNDMLRQNNAEHIKLIQQLYSRIDEMEKLIK